MYRVIKASLSLITIFCIGISACQIASAQSAKFNNSAHIPLYNHQMVLKADSVLSKMTLEEKVGQLTQFSSNMTITGPYVPNNYIKLIKEGKIGSILNAYGAKYTYNLQKIAVNDTRLHIPLLFGYDVIHGFKTEMPVPLAEASTWNPALIEKGTRVAATEASAAGLHWAFAPMVDIARDPRWGRIVEGAGEDPYLGSAIAVARVKGFQGDNLATTNTVLASVKHFAAYGAAEAGRDYNTVDMSMRRLRSVYLPPYKAAVDAGVATVMASFNTLNGIPSTANHFLITKILRNEWGFKGFVVSDWGAIQELENHRIAKDDAQAAEEAINAGIDMDMQSGLYLKELPRLVREGKVKIQTIDNAVRKILLMKFALGLFQNPYAYCDTARERKETMTQQDLETSREIARKSIILLNNDTNILPLKNNLKSIAVLGPLADDQPDLLGPWHGAAESKDVTTVLKGIKNHVSPNTRILYDKGVGITDTSTSGFQNAVNLAKKADVAIVCVGENAKMSGEAASRSNIDIPGKQVDFIKAIYKTGTPVVVVLMNGRPLTFPWVSDHIHSVLETWFLGTEAGNAIADVIFGDYNPSGKLPVTFPRSVGQIPIYYNHFYTGRPYQADNKYTSKYLDIPNTPRYPFGFGLSYTTFKYSDLHLDKSTISTTDSVNVYVTVTNTGKVKGQETAQLYISQLYADVAPRVEKLKGFQQVVLNPGQSKQIRFLLTPDKLSIYNLHMKKVVEPGDFKVMTGTNSASLITTDLKVIQN